MISPTSITDAVTGKPITGAMSWNQYNVQSMAGCINSVHDLMGMIVDTMPSLGDTANAALDRIYYNRADGKFYIKYLNITTRTSLNQTLLLVELITVALIWKRLLSVISKLI